MERSKRRLKQKEKLCLKNEDIEQYIPLVHRIACKVRHMFPNNQYEDLVGWGYIGLMIALQKLKSYNTKQVNSYIGIRIRGSIIDEARKYDEAYDHRTKKKIAYIQNLNNTNITTNLQYNPIHEYLTNLNTSDLHLINMRLAGYTWKEIGQHFKITPAWACMKFKQLKEVIKSATETLV